MKILKTLIILILIIFPFGELLRFDIGNNVVIKPLDLVVGLTIAYWVFLKSKKVQSAKFKVQSYSAKLKITISNKFALSLVLFIFVGLISLVINLNWLRLSEFFVSLLYLIRWIAYAGVFFVIFQLDKKFKKRIRFLLFIDGLIILVIGYIQYFFFNSLKSLYYRGWDEHMHRMFSVFFDPNFAGAFFVLFFILIAGLLNKYQVSSIKYQVFSNAVFLLALLAIFLTFSRSAILMLFVSSITFLFLINKKRLIFVLLGIVLLFGIIASPKFGDENMNLLREVSSKARLENYALALRIFQDHPVIGVGFNSYRYTKDLYGLEHDWTNAPSHADAGVDNSFLFVLATTGVVGGAGYIWIWIIVLRRAFDLLQKKRDILAITTISSSVGLFVSSLFINSLFFAPFMLWIWILIGLMWED